MTDGRRDGSGDEGAGSAPSGDARDLPAPRPDRSPEGVLRTVLSALGGAEDGSEDGIRTAFHFASPTFRATAGGSLAAFRDHLTDPINRQLVGHDGARRGKLVVEGDHATEKVVVTGSDGDRTTYSFDLRKLDDGKYEGCWMVEDVELVYVGESPDHRFMPVVEFDGTEVKCAEGDVLRDVLLRASGVSPHNSTAKYANCNGNGICGTCAVEVVGDVSEKTAQEKRRLKLPPHRGTDDPNYRLACQCRVLGDLSVHKHGGTWGQHVEEYAHGTDEDPDADPIRLSDEEYQGVAAADVDDGDGVDDGEMDLSDDARAVLDEAGDLLDE